MIFNRSFLHILNFFKSENRNFIVTTWRKYVVFNSRFIELSLIQWSNRIGTSFRIKIVFFDLIYILNCKTVMKRNIVKLLLFIILIIKLILKLFQIYIRNRIFINCRLIIIIFINRLYRVYVSFWLKSIFSLFIYI